MKKNKERIKETKNECMNENDEMKKEPTKDWYKIKKWIKMMW